MQIYINSVWQDFKQSQVKWYREQSEHTHARVTAKWHHNTSSRQAHTFCLFVIAIVGASAAASRKASTTYAVTLHAVAIDSCLLPHCVDAEYLLPEKSHRVCFIPDVDTIFVYKRLTAIKGRMLATLPAVQPCVQQISYFSAGTRRPLPGCVRQCQLLVASF